jgi:hypothetical protein
MKQITILVILSLIAIGCVLISGCTSAPGERAQMLNSQPTATIHHSTERDVFMGYLQECSDPDNIQWIYCMDYSGHVIFKSPVKGKTISATKSSEPYSRIVSDPAIIGDASAATEFTGYIPGTEQLMNPSGMFGSDTPGVIWQDPQGNYYEWHNGPYFISSVPLKIDAPVIDMAIDQDMYQREQAVEHGNSSSISLLK